jgi:hypothetical protein
MMHAAQQTQMEIKTSSLDYLVLESMLVPLPILTPVLKSQLEPSPQTVASPALVPSEPHMEPRLSHTMKNQPHLALSLTRLSRLHLDQSPMSVNQLHTVPNHSLNLPPLTTQDNQSPTFPQSPQAVPLIILLNQQLLIQVETLLLMKVLLPHPEVFQN